MLPSLRLALATALLLLLAACLAGLIYLLSTYPVLNAPAPAGTAVFWSTLPTPVLTKSRWASFTAPYTVHAAVLKDGLLWAASDGGAVVWDWQMGTAAKFTTEHGLAENVVTAVAAGPSGALWFGTQSGGVSRFDGLAWQTFSRADGLPSSHINDLAITADGYVWAATANGIGQYDGRRWYSYTRPRTLFQLPGANVRTLAVTADGLTLWAGTDAGAARFNGRRWESFAQIGSQSINDVRDITITPDGMVWVATAGGLKRHDGANWQIFTAADGLENEDVWRVAAAPDNTVWVSYADPAARPTQFDATGVVPIARPLAIAGSQFQVSAVLPSGLLLSQPGHLRYLDNSGAERSFTLPAALPGQQIAGLAAAQSGVWLAGAQGISRFDGTTWQTYTSANGLPGPAVAALTLDGNGQPAVAFQSAASGVSQFNPAQDSWQTTPCPVSGPPSAAVRMGVQTVDGNLWFATNAGIARYDGRAWHIHTGANGLPADNVQTVALDANGAVWAGTDRGVAFYNGVAWQPVTTEDTLALTADPDGTLWYFTGAGLFHLDPDGRAITPIPTPPVSQLYDQLATTGGLWLAAAEGLFYWPEAHPAAAPVWQPATTTEGNAMPEITALLQTSNGDVWAGTNEGLARLQPDQTWQIYPLPALNDRIPITRLANDAQGVLLIGKYDGRLFQYSNGSITVAKVPLFGDENTPVSAIIPHLAGELWVAHFGGGVTRRHGGEWQRFPIADKWQNAAVNSLAWTGGAGWLGTDSGLLALSAGQTGALCVFSAAGDFPAWQAVVADREGQVWGVNANTFWRMEAGGKVRAGALALPLTAVAPDGAVWVVTQNGLVRHANGRRQNIDTAAITAEITALAIAPDNTIWLGSTEGVFTSDGRSWAHTTAADGLAANHVTHIALAPDGAVWFGTVGGVSVLRP